MNGNGKQSIRHRPPRSCSLAREEGTVDENDEGGLSYVWRCYLRSCWRLSTWNNIAWCQPAAAPRIRIIMAAANRPVYKCTYYTWWWNGRMNSPARGGSKGERGNKRKDGENASSTSPPRWRNFNYPCLVVAVRAWFGVMIGKLGIRPRITMNFFRAPPFPVNISLFLRNFDRFVSSVGRVCLIATSIVLFFFVFIFRAFMKILNNTLDIWNKEMF